MFELHLSSLEQFNWSYETYSGATPNFTQADR